MVNLIGIVFYDSSGRLTEPNAALLHILGYTAGQFEKDGMDWQKLLADLGDPVYKQQWELPRKTGRCDSFEGNLIHRDGHGMPVMVSRADHALSKPDDGVAFIVDLRGIKQAAEAMRRSEAALRTANDSIDRGVRVRTAELVAQAERLRALALDLAETESRERKRLARVLHDHFQQLISAAKMKVGILRRRSENGQEIESLRQTETLLEEAINASRSLATELSPPVLHDAGLAAAFEWLVRRVKQSHGLEVRLDLTAWREPAPDSGQLRMIVFECVRELLCNVAKHAHVLTAELVATVPSDGVLQISVIDQGVGFDVLQGSMKRGTDAAFGLFSIQERLSLVGGLMRIVSAPGHGTTIEMTVPVVFTPAVESHGNTRGAAVSGAPLPGDDRIVRVLVADDHELFREGLISLLNQEPYLKIVGEASDGQEAVDMARTLHPDIMICDVTMPKLNGVQVTSIVSHEFPDIKIIGLSMHEQDDMARAMRSAGAVAYCAKSAPIESLVSILRATAAIDNGGLAAPVPV
jgi:PAS domain S-box-containing protein